MQTVTIDRRKLMTLGFVVLIAFAFMNGLQSTSPAVKEKVKEVTAAEAKALIDAGAVVIDVRPGAADSALHIPGAIFIPLEVLSVNLPKIEAYRGRAVVVYCGDGSTSGPSATAQLNRAGFTQAVNLRSGFEGWRAAGLPTKAG